MKPVQTSAYQGDFQGEHAVWLRYGAYEAAILPEIGANLIAFRDVERGYRFLREPSNEEMDAFKAKPYAHGIPVLFPPNRYDRGIFPWRGETLQLPVNETELDNHLHGFLHNVGWTVDHFGHSAAGSFVSVSIRIDESHPVYAHFPFRFTFEMKYTLDRFGLQQQVTIRNDGEKDVPCLLGFHTAVNAPFIPGESAKNYRMKLTLGERWAMDDRMLPTAKTLPLTPEEQLLQGEGIYPFYEATDNHYSALPQNGRNRMELTSLTSGLSLVYDVDLAYRHWMFWNHNGKEGFFCPEPQTCMVNAPQVSLPEDVSGLHCIAPGDVWEASSRMFLRFVANPF